MYVLTSDFEGATAADNKLSCKNGEGKCGIKKEKKVRYTCKDPYCHLYRFIHGLQEITYQAL